MLTKIGTSNTQTPVGGSNQRRQLYDVNTKVAFATMVSGIGTTQANCFLAVLQFQLLQGLWLVHINIVVV